MSGESPTGTDLDALPRYRFGKQDRILEQASQRAKATERAGSPPLPIPLRVESPDALRASRQQRRRA